MFSDPVAAIIFISVIAVVVLTLMGLFTYQMRFFIWSGYFRACFTGEDMRTGSRIIKVDASASDFDIEMFGKIHKYNLQRERIYRSGRSRLPTSYYTIGKPEPIDMLQQNSTSDITAVGYADVARNTVTRDLLAAFETSILTPQNMMIITIAAIGIVGLILGFFVNSKFDKLDEKIGVPTTTTIPTRFESDNLK